MNHVAMIVLGVGLLFYSASPSKADSANYQLPPLREHLSTGPINDPARHWFEVVLDSSSTLGLEITCYFADASAHGLTRAGKINGKVKLSPDPQGSSGEYLLESFAPTTISAQAFAKTLQHCTLVLHHLCGYVLYEGEHLAFNDRFIHIADSKNAISWRPNETGKDVSGVVAALLRRYKLVGSIYYNRHIYLTMEDKSL